MSINEQRIYTFAIAYEGSIRFYYETHRNCTFFDLVLTRLPVS